MEDDIILLIMEDNLNFSKMVDDIHFGNIRRPQYFWKWMTTSLFFNGRRTRYSCYWKTTSIFLLLEDDLQNKKMINLNQIEPIFMQFLPIAQLLPGNLTNTIEKYQALTFLSIFHRIDLKTKTNKDSVLFNVNFIKSIKHFIRWFGHTKTAYYISYISYIFLLSWIQSIVTAQLNLNGSWCLT